MKPVGRWNVLASLGWACLLLAFPRIASAQTAADSVAVVATAWQEIVGAAPAAHPSGGTNIVCLVSELGIPATAQMSSILMGEIEHSIAYRFGFHFSDGCRSAVRDEDGWVRDSEGAPALLARIFKLEFSSTGEAAVGLDVGAGVRRGAASACDVRQADDGSWRSVHCRSVAQR